MSSGQAGGRGKDRDCAASWPQSTPKNVSDICLYGTPEPVAMALRLTAGPLALDVIEGTVRGLCWRDVEVIRAIDCPIRDSNWTTCALEVSGATLQTHVSGFSFECHRQLSDASLRCLTTFKGSSTGDFYASMELTTERDFYTNRAGFTVLHPLEDLSGSPLEVVHRDGSVERLEFPRLVLPGQVVLDICGLRYARGEIRTTIDFSGEIFEMEDQRNWGDASYKTYCRPLALAVPYLLPAGRTLKQEIAIRLSGEPPVHRARGGISTTAMSLRPTDETVPTTAMILEAPCALTSDEIRLARASECCSLLLRLHQDNLNSAFVEARALVGQEILEVELEVVIPEGQAPETWLANVAAGCRQASLTVSRVLALPEAYLKSYQPTGPWPIGPTPEDATRAAREAFPDAQIGAGVLTNFAELNRCRPDPTSCDYIAHAFTALVHAADDRSVIECLEGMSHVLGSAKKLAGSVDYRLGLVSIGMRTNPYGLDVASNPHQARIPMARIDPRQRGLFGAAWAVGALAATEGHCLSSVALAAPVGPFGIAYRGAEWPQPLYDGGSSSVVYPLFHVVRAFSRLNRRQRLAVTGLPPEVRALAARVNEGCFLIVANLSTATRVVRLPCRGTVRVLNSETFFAANANSEWLSEADADFCCQVTLAPFNIGFVEMPGAALE